MDIDNDNDETVVNEDRLSTLPDELIHQILSCIDTKFSVQTCLLSRRWKLLWTSMPYLNFASDHLGSLPKFAKFVKHVLTLRNHEIEVSSLKLRFKGAASQVFVRKIADYAFTHNVQELTVVSFPQNNHEFPPCLFSSQSLKHFTFSSQSFTPCLTPKTPWDFPALTTLHLSQITLCDDDTKEPVDIFSKCVNLKNLTLEDFNVEAAEVFNIISPRLSDLMLIDGVCSEVMNLIAPQLENLTVVNCSVIYLNAPPGLLSFSYRYYRPLALSNGRFHSLKKVNMYLSIHRSDMPYTEKLAHEIIDMLQVLHSAKFLALNIDIVECLSAFPDLLSHHPSSFRNLVCLNIDSSQRNDTYDFKLSTQACKFFLENSPTAKFTMELPEKPVSKAMRQKVARARRKAKLVAEVESHIKELEASLEQRKTMMVDKKREKEKTKAAIANLMTELHAWADRIRLQYEDPKAEMQTETDNEKPQIEVPEIQVDGRQADTKSEELVGLGAQIYTCLRELRDLVKQEEDYIISIFEKEDQIRILLEKLPKGPSAFIDECHSHDPEETVEQCGPLFFEIVSFQKFIDAAENNLADIISTLQDVAAGKYPPASSSSAMVC